METARSEATFGFIDIAGYTALTETHGDEAAADLVALFTALLDRAAAGRGTVLEVVGDGALVVCDEARQAVALVANLFEAAHHVPHFPALRVGLHRGPVLRRGARYFGTTVNLAARVAARACGGQVLATQAVAEAARAEGLTVAALGAFRPRNLTEAVPLYAIDIAHRGADCPVDPVCRMRVAPHHAARTRRYDERDYWFCSDACADRFAADPALYVEDDEAGR